MRLRRCQHKKRHWPDFHGAMEELSGHLTSDLHRPMGSSVDGTFITARDLRMMALIAACLEKRPWLLIHCTVL